MLRALKECKRCVQNVKECGAQPCITVLANELQNYTAFGEAKVVCGLPIPRYVDERCYSNEVHLDNVQDEEIRDVHKAARNNRKACLLAAFPDCTILYPMAAFMDEGEDVELVSITSSGRVSIWKEGDPVHLTETAYGDIADLLIDII